ncbi:hypothetical protein BCR33DRAFT_719494, partial [Rhizoclosmatium globosum]
MSSLLAPTSPSPSALLQTTTSANAQPATTTAVVIDAVPPPQPTTTTSTTTTTTTTQLHLLMPQILHRAIAATNDNDRKRHCHSVNSTTTTKSLSLTVSSSATGTTSSSSDSSSGSSTNTVPIIAGVASFVVLLLIVAFVVWFRKRTSDASRGKRLSAAFADVARGFTIGGRNAGGGGAGGAAVAGGAAGAVVGTGAAGRQSPFIVATGNRAGQQDQPVELRATMPRSVYQLHQQQAQYLAATGAGALSVQQYQDDGGNNYNNASYPQQQTQQPAQSYQQQQQQQVPLNRMSTTNSSSVGSTDLVYDTSLERQVVSDRIAAKKAELNNRLSIYSVESDGNGENGSGGRNRFG